MRCYSQGQETLDGRPCGKIIRGSRVESGRGFRFCYPLDRQQQGELDGTGPNICRLQLTCAIVSVLKKQRTRKREKRKEGSIGVE